MSGEHTVGLLSGIGNVRLASVRRGIVYRGYALGEVSLGLLSSHATVLEPVRTLFLNDLILKTREK